MNKLAQLIAIPLIFSALTTTAFSDFQFTFDGHAYQVITTSSSWEAASAAARSKTVNGVQGYLAHIDNLQENTAIFDQLMANISSNDFGNTSSPDGGGAAYVWIGANDISTEGTWVWVDDGTQFWRGGTGGSSVDGRFNNWPLGFEPDNWRQQDAAGITLTGFPVVGSSDPWGAPSQWNDVNINNNLYYVVEFDTGEFDTGNNFEINPGLNDAWYNPDTSGQGFLISVFPEIKQMFLAWFTFDTERPPEDATALLGEPGHRWLTAQGPYDGDTANLTIFMTEGGVFDAAEPVVSMDPAGYGTMTIEFADCTEGLANYEITSLGISGVIPIQRIVLDNIPLCESLEEQLHSE